MPNWTKKMDTLLIWMRKKNMAYSFCSVVISREVGFTRTKNACISRYYKLTEAQNGTS